MGTPFYLYKLTPVLIMTLFITINIVLFTERGTYSSIIHILKEGEEGEKGLSDWQVGVLASIFMAGFMFTCPLAAHFSQHVHPFRLMTLGLLIWSIACMSFRITKQFNVLVFLRALTGVGEAGFISLAPAVIVDSAPANRKTVYMGIFFVFIPVGVAIGFIYGELIAEITGDWTWAFAVLGFIMAGLTILIGLTYPDPKFAVRKDTEQDELGKNVEGEASEQAASPPTLSLGKQISIILGTQIFCLISFGYAAHNYTVGSLVIWMNDFLVEYFQIDPLHAVATFGSITIFNGVIASIVGSVINDKRVEAKKNETGATTDEEIAQLTIERSMQFSALCLVLGLPIMLLGWASNSFFPFIVCLAISEYIVLQTIGPLNIAILSSVEKHLRGQVVAINVFIIHLFGDFPSPIITGILNEEIGMYWSMFTVIIYQVQALILWYFAWRKAAKSIMKQKSVEY